MRGEGGTMRCVRVQNTGNDLRDSSGQNPLVRNMLFGLLSGYLSNLVPDDSQKKARQPASTLNLSSVVHQTNTWGSARQSHQQEAHTAREPHHLHQMSIHTRRLFDLAGLQGTEVLLCPSWLVCVDGLGITSHNNRKQTQFILLMSQWE